jgi:signal transduction histidine kinase
VQTARSLTTELSSSFLHQRGLAAALEWLRTWCDEKYGLEVQTDIEQGTDPCPEASANAFHCVRELLFNVVKHAGVRKAGLRMWRAGDDLMKIEISDEGSGFDLEEVRAREGSIGGFGLFHSRERLEWLGGKLEIQSSPGTGSRFTLSIPLNVTESARKENEAAQALLD